MAVGVEDDRTLAVHLLQPVGVALGLGPPGLGIDRRLLALDHGERLAVVAPEDVIGLALAARGRLVQDLDTPGRRARCSRRRPRRPSPPPRAGCRSGGVGSSSSSKARVSAACWPCCLGGLEFRVRRLGDRLAERAASSSARSRFISASWAATRARMAVFSRLSFFSASVPSVAAGRCERRAVGLRAAAVVQVHPAAQFVGFLEQPEGGLASGRPRRGPPGCRGCGACAASRRSTLGTACTKLALISRSLRLLWYGLGQPVLVVDEEDDLLGEGPQLGGGAGRVGVGVLLGEARRGSPAPPSWVAGTRSSGTSYTALDPGRSRSHSRRAESAHRIIARMRSPRTALHPSRHPPCQNPFFVTYPAASTSSRSSWAASVW